MKMKSRDESFNTSGELDGSNDLLTGNPAWGQRRRNIKQRFLKLLPCCHTESTPTIRKNSIEDDFELPTVCCRPEGLEKLLEQTKFNRNELQVLYRGFKNECPTGLVNEDTFKLIYSHLFPQGDSSMYAHFLFEAFDTHKNGGVSFEDIVTGMSIILRGTVTDRLCWAFSLYDLNKDGCITKEEMNDIVKSIYDMMGKCTYPCMKDSAPKEHVESFFRKMDRNNDGVITMEEFLESCQKNTKEDILKNQTKQHWTLPCINTKPLRHFSKYLPLSYSERESHMFWRMRPSWSP